MLIKDIKIEKIFDSRGNPTVEASMFNEEGAEFKGSVPAGKNRGSGKRMLSDFSDAKKFGQEIIKPHCVGNNFSTIREFDDYLIKLGGTTDTKKIGGNVILAVFHRFFRALLPFERQRNWRGKSCARIFLAQRKATVPMIFANPINGGAHADSNFDIQEYMAIANPVSSIAELVERVSGLYKNLGDYLQKNMN